MMLTPPLPTKPQRLLSNSIPAAPGTHRQARFSPVVNPKMIMASDSIDVSVAQDGGIVKIVIDAAPDGADGPPFPGSEVTAHYTGKLESDGSKFDSSHDRGKLIMIENATTYLLLMLCVLFLLMVSFKFHGSYVQGNHLSSQSARAK